MNLILTPGKVTLSEFSQIYWKNVDVALNHKSKSEVDKAARIVEQAAGEDAPIYGINTGFGEFSETVLEIII